jgi:hypothetical protein
MTWDYHLLDCIIKCGHLNFNANYFNKAKLIYFFWAGLQWLTPAILAPWEAEMWKIVVERQPWQQVSETPS